MPGADVELVRALECEGPFEMAADYGVNGCFGGVRHSFALRRSVDGLVADVDLDEVGEHSRVVGEPVETVSQVLLREALAGPIARPPKEHGRSTATIFIRLTVRCGTQQLVRVIRGSESRPPDFETLEPFIPDQAELVYDALVTFSNALPLVSGPQTEEQQKANAARWGALYDASGMRVRHDPDDPWANDVR